MKYGKKLIAVLMVVLGVFCLSACGNKENTESENLQKEEVNEVVNEVTDEEKELPELDIAPAIGQSWDEFSKNFTEEELVDFKKQNEQEFEDGGQYEMMDSNETWFMVYTQGDMNAIGAVSISEFESRANINGVAIGDKIEDVQSALQNSGYTLAETQEMTEREDIDVSYVYEKDERSMTVCTKDNVVVWVVF